MAQAASSKEDLLDIAQRLTAAFEDGSAKARLDERIADKGMMFAPQLLAEIETMQREMFASWGYEPNGTLQNLQGAVRAHPDTRPAIMKLCDVEEVLINNTQEALAKKHNIQMPMQPQGGHGGHGHSHGGHGHSHGGHGHSHGGHGHGHGETNFAPGDLIAQQLSMQLVQRSFKPEQLQFMQQLQMKAMSGQMPTGDEQLQAMQIQQAMMKKMANMQSMVKQAFETFDDDERKNLFAIEEKMKSGQGIDEADAKAVQAARDNIATYIATMGPMLMSMKGADAAPGSSVPEPAAAAADKPAGSKKSE